jgi:Cu-Zn family superoxide dismutase
VLATVVVIASCAPREDARDAQEAEIAETPSQPELLLCFNRGTEATKIEDWAGARDAFLDGIEVAPDVPALHLAAAGAEARLGNDAASRAHLEALARLGATADLEADDSFAEYLSRPDFLDLANRLRTNGAPHPAAEVVHIFEDKELWPEGIAIDRATGELYVGSIHRRAIFRLATDGSLHEVEWSPPDDLGEVIGIWVDSDRRALWAATGDGEWREPVSGPPRTNGLVRIDLETGDLTRFPVPDDEVRLLNDVVVAPDGTVWATESVRSEVYRISPGSELELYRRFPEMVFLNGLAVSGDGRTLFLGHYGGLSALDLEEESIQPVRGNDMALGMIDGMSWVDDRLVLVQNNRHVNFRVVRVDLDAGARTAENLDVLPSGLPEGLIPYTCAVGDDSVYVVAAATFDLMDRGEVPPAPAIVRMPLVNSTG